MAAHGLTPTLQPRAGLESAQASWLPTLTSARASATSSVVKTRRSGSRSSFSPSLSPSLPCASAAA